MGNIVLMMSVSADGVIEGPDRDIGWHLVDDELMAGFWPTADSDPDSTPRMVEFAHRPRLVGTRTFGNGGVLLHHRRA